MRTVLLLAAAIALAACDKKEEEPRWYRVTCVGLEDETKLVSTKGWVYTDRDGHRVFFPEDRCIFQQVAKPA